MHSGFFFLFFFCCLATTTRFNAMRAHVAPALKLLSLSLPCTPPLLPPCRPGNGLHFSSGQHGWAGPGERVCGWVCAAVPHGKTGPSDRPSVRPPASQLTSQSVTQSAPGYFSGRGGFFFFNLKKNICCWWGQFFAVAKVAIFPKKIYPYFGYNINMKFKKYIYISSFIFWLP